MPWKIRNVNISPFPNFGQITLIKGAPGHWSVLRCRVTCATVSLISANYISERSQSESWTGRNSERIHIKCRLLNKLGVPTSYFYKRILTQQVRIRLILMKIKSTKTLYTKDFFIMLMDSHDLIWRKCSHEKNSFDSLQIWIIWCIR